MSFEGNLGNNKAEKISKLRAAISRAETREDEETVLRLEAELKAVERGETFNEEEFLVKRAKSKARPAHHVLRDMENLPYKPSNDVWVYDGLEVHKRESKRSYEYTFQSILSQIGVEDFQELAELRASQLKREIQVLDLFGGAYFLSDLQHVSKIVGVRLGNIDRELVVKEKLKAEIPQILRSLFGVTEKETQDRSEILDDLVNNKKRLIIEGSLYQGKIWNKLFAENKNIGFDIIVCRPEGPFGHTDEKNIKDVPDNGLSREKIFVVLLERTLRLMSEDGGLLFTQIPELKTPTKDWDEFWENYIPKKQNEGYEFLFGQGRKTPTRDAFAVRRNQSN